MGYTKGEWKACFDKENRYHIMCVGSNKPSQEGMKRNICRLADRSIDETEANAQLMAAAPDMERELENLVFLISNDGIPYSQIQQAIVSSRKALAKAGGK